MASTTQHETVWSNKARASLGLVMLAILFVSVNVIASNTLQGVRIDVTEDELFTVSGGTKEVLENIPEPVHLRLYYSPPLGDAAPAFATYYQRVRTLLQQYADLAARGAPGRLVLEFANPEPFSDTEDRAVAFGLQGIALGESGDLGYFGLAATNSTDDQEVILFLGLERESFLEYDLTKMIASLAKPEKPEIGLISTLPVMGGPPLAQGQAPQPRWALIDAIAPFYRVRNLGPGIETIDPDIGILLIVHPGGLSEVTQYAIDQFVLHGGRAVVFVDPNPEISRLYPSPLGPRLPQASDFTRLLKAWGVEMEKGVVAADIDAARRVSINQGGQQQPADYVAWLEFGPENGDADDPVAGAFTLLHTATAGILNQVEGAKTTFTPLLKTGERSMRLQVDQVRNNPDVLELFRKFQPSGEKLTVAARISGATHTAFPNGPPDEYQPPEGEEASTHYAASRSELNVVVVADVDMLHEILWASRQNVLGQTVLVPNADNGYFVVNVIDNMAGSDALIGLRARTVQQRPFTLVEDLRRASEQAYLQREQDLLDQLSDVRYRLAKLTQRDTAAGSDPANDLAFSEEDNRALVEARAEMITTRQELRAVQRALRANIEQLELTVKAVNTFAAPALLTLIGLGVAVIGRRRRAQAVKTG